MPSRTLQIIALTLAALGLAPGAAHLMEMPVKLAWSPALYADVTSTLYAWFGPVAGSIQIAATIALATLAFQARRLPEGRLLAASAAALLISILLWASLVAPVNSVWEDSAGADRTAFVEVYGELRTRWEYGHLAAFIAWLAGWFGLVVALTTRRAPRPDGVD